MADEKVEESQCGTIDGANGVVLGPEKGPTGALTLLYEAADKALAENLLTLVPALVESAKEKHLLSLKMLVDLAGQAAKGKDVTREEVESLAERLTRDLQELGELPVR